MAYVETKTLRDEAAIDERLAEIGLDRKKLLKVRDIAIGSAANATPFHASNAAGTFSYQDGTWALRNEFVDGSNWTVDRTDGVEAIKCEARKTRIAFCNVDVAANDFHSPHPRSKKGSGAERASGLGPDLFGGDLPQFSRPPQKGWALYYLMVDEAGAAELSRPRVQNGTFASQIERIYLPEDKQTEAQANRYVPEAPADNFDPLVVRKK